MKLKNYILGFILLLVAGYLFYTETNIIHSVKNLMVNFAIAQETDNDNTKKDARNEKKEEVDDKTKAENLAIEKKKQSEKIKLMFDGLEAKRLRNQKKEAEINQKLEKLQALKAELDEKLEKLAEVHGQIKQSLEKFNKMETDKERLQRQKEERKLNQLVKVYTSMKPKQAGEIINKLDILIAEKLFLRMKGEVAGRILSYVNSEKAAKISERLAENDMVIGD